MAVNRTDNGIPVARFPRVIRQLEGHQKNPPNPKRRRGKALRHEQTHHPNTIRSEAHVEARKRRVALRDEKDPTWRSSAKEKVNRNAELRREQERLRKEAEKRVAREVSKKKESLDEASTPPPDVDLDKAKALG